MKCQGWAYEPCHKEALGNLYQGYADGSWEMQPICIGHFVEVSRTLSSRVQLPVHLELHGFDSIGPAWTRVSGDT